MNLQMMEGLVGASTNIRLSGSPMRVYRQAEAQGDSEKMKRALGYAGECTERAAKYQEKLDKGMKEEAEKAREETKPEREAAMEKTGQERGKTEDGARPGRPPETDTVQLSRAAQALLESGPAKFEIPPGGRPTPRKEPGGTVVPPTPEPAFSTYA